MRKPLETFIVVGHHENEREIYFDVTDEQYEKAEAEYLDDDDQLMDDVLSWIEIEDGDDLSMPNIPPCNISRNDRFLLIAKLLRDDNAEFRAWQAKKHLRSIERRAEEIATAEFEANL